MQYEEFEDTKGR